jgi:hypothetical protein
MDRRTLLSCHLFTIFRGSSNTPVGVLPDFTINGNIPT